MHRSNGRKTGLLGPVVLVATLIGTLATSARAIPIDSSQYLSPDELEPGMKGYGRTVISGTDIETFGVEVISVMRNAFYAGQDVILVRCSGLNLEHTGIIAGMSGSPCYIKGKDGKDRMIGAIAYGWSFNKDPIAGVQPITQMLDVAQVRDPESNRHQESRSVNPPSRPVVGHPGTGVSLAEIVAAVASGPIEQTSRFSVFNKDIEQSRPDAAVSRSGPECLQRLRIPVMTSGISPQSMARLQDWFEQRDLLPVAAGGVTKAGNLDPEQIRMEPGAALVVPLITGDIHMEGLGTCTDVIGNRVLGFGHRLFADGKVELPFATGFVHTVIPGVRESVKLGGSLKNVGTLWGDESSAIFGTLGETPGMIPLEIVLEDLRGKRSYHYNIVRERFMSGPLMTIGLAESVYAHSNLPTEHSVQYAVEMDFGQLGVFRTSNFTSRTGVSGAEIDLMYPAMLLMNAPFEQSATPLRAKVEVTIREGTRTASIDQIQLPRETYKPGETINARIRWYHYRQEPQYSFASYTFKTPADLPDGKYELQFASASAHLMNLRTEKPHLFQADNLDELLQALNMLGSFPEDQLYIRLGLKTGGLAYKKVEMPDLPSYRLKILADTGLTDLQAFSEALVVQHKTAFAISGRQTVPIEIKRRQD